MCVYVILQTFHYVVLRFCSITAVAPASCDLDCINDNKKKLVARRSPGTPHEFPSEKVCKFFLKLEVRLFSYKINRAACLFLKTRP